MSDVRREMALEHFKWDPQVGDTSVLCERPLILEPWAWQDLAALAEQLDSELLAAEEEILARGRLIDRLGLPRSIVRVLRHGGSCPTGPRVTRYDFHHTSQGWRISEANSDVPGGYVEASAYTRSFAQRCPSDARPAPDPILALVRAIGRFALARGRVALVYATGYSDDAQVMHLLARALQEHGHDTIAGAPDMPLDGIAHLVRFFPAEWLPALGRSGGRRERWHRFFAGEGPPQTNPGRAIVTQSKRWTLLWDALDTPLPTWRRLCPSANDVGGLACPLSERHVYKPALGRVGDAVILDATTRPLARDRSASSALRALRRERLRRTLGRPGHWLAQERFEPLGRIDETGTERAVCLGVYVIDGKAAGVYGRLATGGHVDHAARDVAVLVAQEHKPQGVPVPCH